MLIVVWAHIHKHYWIQHKNTEEKQRAAINFHTGDMRRNNLPRKRREGIKLSSASECLNWQLTPRFEDSRDYFPLPTLKPCHCTERNVRCATENKIKKKKQQKKAGKPCPWLTSCFRLLVQLHFLFWSSERDFSGFSVLFWTFCTSSFTCIIL